MSRKILSFILIGMLVVLCSCAAQPSVEGDELIKKAREDYKSLDSAKVIMTNTETDEVEQTFEFKYDEKGFLTYSYEGKNDGEVYAQYNNGVESFTYENGEFSYLQKGDKDFGAYTRDTTHPQADEGLIIFNASAVNSASKTESDGVVNVHHEYDTDKLETDEDITAFSVDYYFDDEGNLLYFIEESEMGGKKHSYKVEIIEKNSVDKVENTVEKYKNE